MLQGDEIVFCQDPEQLALILLRKDKFDSFIDVGPQPIPESIADDLRKTLFSDESDDPGSVVKVSLEDDVDTFHRPLFHKYIITHLRRYVNICDKPIQGFFLT